MPRGDPFPARTVKLLGGVDAALFGAITSKPMKAAAASSAPSSAGKDSSTARRSSGCGSSSTSTLPAPVQGLSRQSAELPRGDRHRRLPREHRGPVRRRRVLARTGGAGGDARQRSRTLGLRRLAPAEYAISCKINTRKGSARIARAAFEFAREKGVGKSRSSTRQRGPRDRWTVPRRGAEVARDYPEIVMDDANIDAIRMWLLKNPFNYDVLVAPNLYGDIVSDLARRWLADWDSELGEHRGEARRVRAHPRLRAKHAASTRRIRSPPSSPPG